MLRNTLVGESPTWQSQARQSEASLA